MSQLVNYSIIEAGLRALADKAHESAVAQAEGKPIPCGLSENDMELVALLTAMMNDTQALCVLRLIPCSDKQKVSWRVLTTIRQ